MQEEKKTTQAEAMLQRAKSATQAEFQFIVRRYELITKMGYSVKEALANVRDDFDTLTKDFVEKINETLRTRGEEGISDEREAFIQGEIDAIKKKLANLQESIAIIVKRSIADIDYDPVETQERELPF